MSAGLQELDTISAPAKVRQPLRFGILLRRIHMYLGLFLTPWLTMYALSTVVFNHWERINSYYGGQMGKFAVERELAYQKTFPAGATLRSKGEQILEDLNLNGSFGIQQREGSIVINRRDPAAPRRITYTPASGKIVIEREAFRAANLLTTLHSQVGYTNKLNRIKAWAASVDLTAFATLLLVLTGFWMWWELKVTRAWGTFFIVFGIALFGLFLRFA